MFEISHKPKTDHPKKLCSKITKRILNLHRRNPDYSFIEIWVNLKHEGKQISAISVLRTLKRAHEYGKYVPNECKIEGLDGRFYQYTILDECSRKRALYFTNEHSMYETVNALKYAKNILAVYQKKFKLIMDLNFPIKLEEIKIEKIAVNTKIVWKCF